MHPSLTLQLTKDLTVVGDVDFFWKHRVEDAIYTPPGRPLVPTGLSDSRYIGSQANAWLTRLSQLAEDFSDFRTLTGLDPA